MSTEISKRALSAGLGVGALALFAQTQRASADTPFSSFAFAATGAPTPRTMPDRLAEIVNVKDFGAVGDGATDDAVAIQKAFDAAFGPVSAPNGNAKKYLNRPVFFPSGNYLVSKPLYLVNVMGAHIYGTSAQTTSLTYTGAYTGNTQVANGITALIMTNGLAYSRIERLNLKIGNNNSTCLYLYQDGTGGQTNQNTFSDILFDGASAGALIGYQSNALCSEMLFLSCTAGNCGFGFRNISQNALNNNFVGCGAFSCGTGFSCPTGSIQINCASLAGNNTDIATGQNPMTIIGSRTESAKFVDTTTSGGVTHYISGCIQDAQAPGYFVNVGSSNKAILDACIQNGTTSTFGMISGTTGSKIYLRACIFNNASYLGGFTGTVAQNI